VLRDAISDHLEDGVRDLLCGYQAHHTDGYQHPGPFAIQVTPIRGADPQGRGIRPVEGEVVVRVMQVGTRLQRRVELMECAARGTGVRVRVAGNGLSDLVDQ
jgi:hypothetical protein